MSAITSLAKAQWQQLYAHRETWYRIGSACGATNQEVAREVIGDFSRLGSYTEPSLLFVRSPQEALSMIEHRWMPVRWQIMDGLWDELWRGAYHALSPDLFARLNMELYIPLEKRLGGLRDCLWDDLVSHQGMAPVTCDAFFSGCYEAFWVAYYLFLQELGVAYSAEQQARLFLWKKLVCSMGCFWSFRDVWVIADRPVTQHVDIQYRLHNEHGPAMHFSDGYSLYAEHGEVTNK